MLFRNGLKTMKQICLAVLSSLLAPAAVPILSSPISFAQANSIYGTFQNCPFHCLTIKINTDHTFVYRLTGDLYNNQRVGGTWKLKGRNRIQAVSPENRSAPNVVETVSARDDGFVVIVKDFAGSLVTGVEISTTGKGSIFSVKTNNDGQAIIPKSTKFEIAFDGLYRGMHVINNSRADEFTVTLTVDQVVGMAVNEEWLIEGNRLFIVRPDGSVNRDFPLVRLSQKAEKRIGW